MRFLYAIGLIVLITICAAGLLLLWRHTLPEPMRYDFIHANRDGWANQHNTYRLDRTTGAVTRLSVFRHSADPQSGRPAFEQVIVTDLLSGVSTANNLSIYKDELEAWRNRNFDPDKYLKAKPSPDPYEGIGAPAEPDTPNEWGDLPVRK